MAKKTVDNKSTARAFHELSERVHRALKGRLKLVSTTTFAEMLDCSPTYIWKARKQGLIPEPKVKLFKGQRGYRWTLEQVERYIQNRTLSAS